MTDLTLFIDVTEKQCKEFFNKTGYTKIYIVDYLVNGNWGTENKVLQRLNLIYKYIFDQVSKYPRRFPRNYLRDLRIKSTIYIPETEVPKLDESITRTIYEILDTPDYPGNSPQDSVLPVSSDIRESWWTWCRTRILKDLDKADDQFIEEIVETKGLNFNSGYISGDIIIYLTQKLISKWILGFKKFEFEVLRTLMKDVVCQL